ncbi:epigen isoform X4 [Cricetulus griseus]|uniref:Epigen isoform X4 n=1 Tax=Cricetulus griseus TaxID=10029 RepID=A0A9J7J6I4_CRIGR|nr:epigen isoform X4 [Cricetulus griseus]XP_027244191.1 epigen isoform X4 [Cricetulus griseus]
MKYKWRKDSESTIKNPPPFCLGGPVKEVQQLQDMALGVAMAVCLLFKAMATALTEEAEVHVIPPSLEQQSNGTVNDTEADYIEGPVALKFSHPCLEDHNNYCINGVCAFHHELKKAICRCLNLKSPYIICSGGRPL